MPRPLLPPRGIFVPTMMIYNREIPPKVVYTWIQLRGLAWDRTETPQLSMAQLSDLTGKSQSTLYAHIALLRSWGALRMRPSVKGSIIVAFPVDTGQILFEGDNLPAQLAARFNSDSRKGDSEFLDSRNLEMPDPSPSSPINYLDSDSVGEREVEINQLDLSQYKRSQDSENLERISEKSESPLIEGKEIPRSFESPPFGEGMENSHPPTLPPHLDGADPIKIYKTLTGIRPNKPQRDRLNSLVHDTNLWYLSVEHWQSHGWNPKNIAGILELYQRGGPTTCRYCSKEKDPESQSISALNSLREELEEPSNGLP